MKLIWLFYFIEILILTLLRPLATNFEAIGVIAVLTHGIFTLLVLYSNKKKIRKFFLLGYLIRLVGLFWDLYARNIFYLPHSGADSESFYRQAILLSTNLKRISLERELYVQINGVLMSLIGPQRIFLQYMNVLLGITVIFFIYKIMKALTINNKTCKNIMLLAALFPTSVVLSSIFLREIFPTFFVVLSLYFFVKWYNSPRYSNILYSFLYLGIASMFHSGVSGIAIGYLFAYLFYKHQANNFRFTLKTITVFIIITVLLFPILTIFNEQIFRKFGNLNESEDLYRIATGSKAGGAVYLKGLTINSFLDFILYSPIKSIYFLISPLPWDWRNLSDIMTFLLDSLLYLYTAIASFKLWKNLKKRKPLIILFLIMIISTSIIFGVGVGNAGTALRHRQKISPLFLILISLLLEERNDFNQMELV